MADSRAIGVFDSGLGGLTVVRELIGCNPNENIVYFGDTGRVPYGTRSRETIKKYAVEDEQFLLKHNVKLIIAACGTVSSVASDTADNLPVPFFEMVTHAAKAAVNLTKNRKIGVIGTAATVSSGSHKKEILRLLPEAVITAESCPLFVPLVESGWYNEDDVVVLETVRRYLAPIIAADCDTLILGCTHYPVLEGAIRRVTEGKITLINPGVAVSKAVSDFIMNKGIENDSKNIGHHNFYVSDKPDSFKAQASVLLGKEFDDRRVEQVDLNTL
ncbi:MAG: glutamate racemase [Acutalibacteraceae bacterium]|nr:glutamate racemase [Acutalibacteraceae bacterium]